MYVKGYYRKDGTYVQPYYKTRPDDTVLNNYSCIDDGRCGSSSTYLPDESVNYQPEPTILRCVLPILGERGTPQVTRDGCNQNIELTWDKGLLDEEYSVFLSRSPNDEPDDTVDTKSQSFLFENVKAGTNYIHIKPGNSCGWGQSKYWEVKVEDIEPSLELSERINSEDDRDLIIYSDCAQKIQVKPLGTSYSQNSKVLNIKPKKDTVYTVTAVNGKASKTKTIQIAYPLPTSTPTFTPTMTPKPTPTQDLKENKQENTSFWQWLKKMFD